MIAKAAQWAKVLLDHLNYGTIPAYFATWISQTRGQKGGEGIVSVNRAVSWDPHGFPRREAIVSPFFVALFVRTR